MQTQISRNLLISRLKYMFSYIQEPKQPGAYRQELNFAYIHIYIAFRLFYIYIIYIHIYISSKIRTFMSLIVACYALRSTLTLLQTYTYIEQGKALLSHAWGALQQDPPYRPRRPLSHAYNNLVKFHLLRKSLQCHLWSDFRTTTVKL